MSKIEVNAIEPQCGTTLTVGASGDTITFPTGTTIVNNGTQTGFGRTGTVDWQTTPKTATFTAANGEGYFCNTSGGAFTVNLPAGSAGAIVSLADYAGTFQTNNLTVSPNGSEKIGGATIDVTLSTEGQSVTLIYVDGTQGWVTTADSSENVVGNQFICASVSGACNTLVTAPCCANTKIATFTGPGDFTVTNAANCAANNVVSYMVVAGGGGGGGGYIAGGGGAGGFREFKSPVTPYTASPLAGGTPISVSATTYPIVIGAGGAGNALAGATDATSGSPSTFSSITSTGGGFGKQDQDNPANSPGRAGPGGSGGGGNGGSSNTFPEGRAKGLGNTPPVSPSQGQPGGCGVNTPSGPTHAAGGGGGATVAGVNASSNQGGTGGTGTDTSINPASPISHAGGGGGSARSGTQGAGSPCGTGGAGGVNSNSPAAVAGTINRGGGGGGADGLNSGGNGGSGRVVIRYKFQ